MVAAGAWKRNVVAREWSTTTDGDIRLEAVGAGSVRQRLRRHGEETFTCPRAHLRFQLWAARDQHQPAE